MKILSLILISMTSFVNCSGDEEEIVPDPVNEEIEETGFDGVWSGTGTSSLFPTPYAVTFDLIEEEGVVSGKFYITSSTRPAFGGSDDGTFEAAFAGDSLVDVKVTQILDNMNCPGVFEGAGIIKDNKEIRINWTGTDCSGFHDNGIFRLRKKN